MWKEVINFDIRSPNDAVQILLMDMGATESERLVGAEDIALTKNFDPENDDYDLKVQRPGRGTVSLTIPDTEETVGEVDYSIQWIYNKGHFL